MSEVISERVSAEMDGDFVVFLIGMHINKPWKLHKWLPVFMTMPSLLKEVTSDPDSGCLGVTFGWPVIVQYWRSFEHLEAYARSHDQSHWPAWVAFNKRMRANRGDVGIWHETYKVGAGQFEAIYSGMPASGIGKVGRLVSATGKRESARERVLAGV